MSLKACNTNIFASVMAIDKEFFYIGKFTFFHIGVTTGTADLFTQPLLFLARPHFYERQFLKITACAIISPAISFSDCELLILAPTPVFLLIFSSFSVQTVLDLMAPAHRCGGWGRRQKTADIQQCHSANPRLLSSNRPSQKGVRKLVKRFHGSTLFELLAQISSSFYFMKKMSEMFYSFFFKVVAMHSCAHLRIQT